LLAALVGAMASHLLQIVVFGLAFWLLPKKTSSASAVRGTFEDSLQPFSTFPAKPTPTLGSENLSEPGPLRMICGIASLVGLLMVSWDRVIHVSGDGEIW